ncbi:hypothetical protein [Streptosporangium sp. NPDC051022]|uniref:hypothetical protein n=1 Tax=Streptosporangium sp. NPDC051022 TaxID=3155752 RepID=UPI0034338301
MGELERSETAAAVGVLDVVAYGIVVLQLALAGAKLRRLGEQVRSAYSYVEGCSASVDRLADQMAALDVDPDTVAEHREAAAIMRRALADAERMAATAEDLAIGFTNASATHEAEYGPVVEAARSMPVPMANASFYGNR